jgi:hypothetical protein
MDSEISRLKEYNNELLETLAQVLKDQQELREKYDKYVKLFDEIEEAVHYRRLNF